MVFQSRRDASDAEGAIPANAELPPRVQVADCQIDTVGGVLRRNGTETRLTARACGVLRVLLANAGNTVTREHLIRAVWPDSYPTDDVVTKAVREIRLALGDDPRGGRHIDTIPRIGYRLNAVLGVPEPAPPAAAAPAAAVPTVRATSVSPEASAAPYARRWPVIALALTLLAAAAAYAWSLRPGADAAGADQDTAPRSAAAARLQQGMIAGLQPLTALPGTEVLGSLSPDGGAVTYMASASLGEPFRIYVAPVDSLQARRLTANHDPASIESSPEWSPDGRQIAFQRISPQGCAIYLAPLAGSEERRLLDCEGVFAQFLEFSPDGTELGVFRAPNGGVREPARLQMLSLATGRLRPFPYEITQDPWESDVEARFSPDGRWVAIRRGRPPYGRIYVLPGEGGTASEHAIGRTVALAGFDWLPDSSALLVAAGFSAPSELRLVTPATLERELVAASRLSWPRFAARSERAVFTQSDEHGVIFGFDLGAETGGQPPRRLFESTYSEQSPALAPSGTQMAFVSTRSGVPQVHVGDPRTGEDRQLTRFTHGTVAWPRWSADETELAFVHQGGDSDAVVHILRLSDLRAELVPTGFERVRQAELSADGRDIYVDALTADGVMLWRLSRAGSQRQPLGAGVLLGPRRIPGGADLLAVDPDASTLVRIGPDGSRLAVVAGDLQPWSRYAWDVTARGVYFVGGHTLEAFGLYFQPWQGESTRLAALPRIMPAYGITIDEREGALYLGAAHLASSDLVLMRLEPQPPR